MAACNGMQLSTPDTADNSSASTHASQLCFGEAALYCAAYSSCVTHLTFQTSSADEFVQQETREPTALDC